MNLRCHNGLRWILSRSSIHWKAWKPLPTEQSGAPRVWAQAQMEFIASEFDRNDIRAILEKLETHCLQSNLSANLNYTPRLKFNLTWTLNVITSWRKPWVDLQSIEKLENHCLQSHLEQLAWGFKRELSSLRLSELVAFEITRKTIPDQPLESLKTIAYRATLTQP